jgi:hypothetical protein
VTDAISTEKRVPPDDVGLKAAAEANPGGWVYDIDWSYPDDQPVPPEAIRGSWKVGDDGFLTGEYAPNARYRPIETPQRKLKPYMHAAARSNVDQWIIEMDPTAEPLFPEIPAELIRGWWYVDRSGKITGQFRPSASYRNPG